jgi:iron complex outermembrane recepter protein
VLKGPSSVLNGAMNPGGLINIVTKQPSTKHSSSLSTSLSSYAGSQGHDGGGFSGTYDTTGPLDAGKHWLYRFIASYDDKPAWQQFDWGRNYYFFPSLTYRLNDNTEATLKLEFHREARFGIQDQSLVAPNNLVSLVPSDHSLVYQDPSNSSYDRGDVYNLVVVHRFADKWTAKLNFRDVQHTDGRRLLENRSLNITPVITDSTITQRLRDTWNRRRYAYYDFNVYGTVGPESFQQTLLFGLSAGYETHNFTRWLFQNVTGPHISIYHPVQGLTTYPTVNSTTGTGPTQVAVSKYYNYGAYVSDEIKLGKHWHASIGVHTEKYDTKYTDTAVLLSTGKFVNPGQSAHPQSTVPSFGLVYEPSDTLSFYGSYAESFKPTPPQGVALGAPRPPPETATQKEVGLKSQFLKHQVEVLFSVYEIERKDVVEPVPNVFDPLTGIQVYRALSNRSRGVELSLNLQPVPHWQTQVGFSYNDATVTTSANTTLVGAELANAPRYTGNVWTRYNFPAGALRGLGVGCGVVYTGERNVNVDNRPSQALTLPSNTRVDMAIYYNWKHYNLALNVSNLLDRSYIASGDANTDLIPGAPRKVALSLKYSF